MNTNDLAELAAQKKNDQQISQYQNSENQRYNPNEPCDDSQDLKTPTAENQQSLMENKVVIIILHPISHTSYIEVWVSSSLHK